MVNDADTSHNAARPYTSIHFISTLNDDHIMGAAKVEEERSPKRRRTETNESINFVRDKNFYLDDGNIILIAENTAFKVHKSVFSRHSAVFRDMFLLANGDDPESSSSSENHGECQILRLSDSKQDVVCLLQALYDNIVLSPDELVELSCLLRICNKYLMHRLLKRTLETIEKAVPITYEGYKAAFGTPEHAHREHNELKIGVAAITTGIDIFLPTLYYKFSRFPDPNQFDLLPALSIAKILTGIKPTLECLSNVFQIVKAKQSASDKCHYPTCKSSWKKFSSTFEGYLATPSWLYHPINVLISLCQQQFFGECSTCNSARIDLLDAEARKFWDQLPRIYSVAKSWDELRERHDKLIEIDDEGSSQSQ